MTLSNSYRAGMTPVNMRPFTKITWWENKRRLRLLNDFRELVVSYFDNSKYSWQAEGRIENNTAKDVRVSINRILKEIYSIIRSAGINPSVTSKPPPALGGYINNVDLIINIFDLHQFQIPSDVVFDNIDRSIGVYESNIRSSFIRTINPFFWIGLALEYVVELPFSFLGKAGFNSKRIKDSPIGKIVKAVLYLIVVFASFLTILHFTGYLGEFNHFLKSLLQSG